MAGVFKEHYGLDDRVNVILRDMRRRADADTSKSGRPIMAVVRLNESSKFGLYLLDKRGGVRLQQGVAPVLCSWRPEPKELEKAYGKLLMGQEELTKHAIEAGLVADPSDLVLWWVSLYQNPKNEKRMRGHWKN